MKYIYTKCLLLSIVAILCSATLKAQNTKALYGLQGMPQVSNLFPSYRANSLDWFVQFPFLTFAANIESPVSLYDYNSSTSDTDPNKVDFEKFYNSVSNRNIHLFADADISWLHFGFPIFEAASGWEGFLTFQLSSKINNSISTTSDILAIPLGNVENNNGVLTAKEIGIDKLLLDLEMYNEVSVGLQMRNDDSDWSFGGNLKYLKGLNKFKVKNMGLLMAPEYDATGAYVGSNVAFDLDAFYSGPLDSLDVEADIDIEFPQGNSGFAIDLGASYALDEQWEFHASVLDVGFINWTNNVQVHTSNSDFLYKGGELDLTDNGEEEDDSWDIDIADSITVTSENKKSHLSMLSPRILLGATYKLNEKFYFNALSHSRVVNNSFFSSLSLSASFRPSDWFETTIGYTVPFYSAPFQNNSVPFGFHIRGGVFMFSLATDNIIAAFVPERVKTANAMFTVTFVGYNKKSKKEQQPHTTFYNRYTPPVYDDEDEDGEYYGDDEEEEYYDDEGGEYYDEDEEEEYYDDEDGEYYDEEEDEEYYDDEEEEL